MSATPPQPLMATASSSQEDMMRTLVQTFRQEIQEAVTQTSKISSISRSSSTDGSSVCFNSPGPNRQSANTRQNRNYRNSNSNNRYNNIRYNSSNQQSNRYNNNHNTPNQQRNRNNINQQPCRHCNRTNHQSLDCPACFDCVRLGHVSRECRSPMTKTTKGNKNRMLTKTGEITIKTPKQQNTLN